MPECRYCGDELSDETAYHEHLREAHLDELGPIDRRRIQSEKTPLTERVPVALVAVLAIAVTVVGFVIFATGGSGGSADGPTGVGTVHVHGTLVMSIDGERVDFSQPRYQYPNGGSDAFHFEGGNGVVYHVHAQGVTLEYAMSVLGVDITADSVTYQGTTYRDADSGTTVRITVNGEPVDPEAYVLQGVQDASRAEQGDTVRIVVEQSE